MDAVEPQGDPVPRVAEERAPAEPVSPEQKERYRRILRAAAKHGAERDLERVQMHDVARDAGVAIATLYRYFPSKTQLFTALLRSRVERLHDVSLRPYPGESAEMGISRLLNRVARELLVHPLLTLSMMQANNATVAQRTDDGVTRLFFDLMLEAGGLDDPTPHEVRLLRILEQTWYGLLISTLNGHITAVELESDTELACRLLLCDRDRGTVPGSVD